MRLIALVSLLLGSAAAVPAMAQDRYFNFALTGGLAVAPDYPGASSYGAQPDLGFTFGALKWGRIDAGNGVFSVPDNGFAFRGAFRVIGSRDAADYPELAGLNDIGTGVELGFGVVYRETRWQVFGDVRKGISGHSGVTGTVGADVIFRPDERWTITAGPRVNFGNGEYASTYFGVTPAEAATSAFGAFDASGGVLGAGVAVEAIYQLSNDWAVNGAISYEKLMNDAADSPITMNGDEDQWRLSIGLTRAFSLRF